MSEPSPRAWLLPFLEPLKPVFREVLAMSLFVNFLALAVPAWVLQQIAVRPFYARNDMWRPMLLGTAIAIGVAPLYWVLGSRSGAAGLALAGVLGMTVSALATLALALADPDPDTPAP